MERVSESVWQEDEGRVTAIKEEKKGERSGKGGLEDDPKQVSVLEAFCLHVSVSEGGFQGKPGEYLCAINE